MRMALSLAEKGRGGTSPNPMVGAVLVKAGKVVGRGFHRAAGRDHAERVAVKAAGAGARGATLYVTLEPCCHEGRTSPCTEVIITAGIRKVVYSTKDPDPRVNGKGARLLKRAGLIVENGLLKAQARRLNEAYFTSLKYGRPFVVLKTAQTLDGRIAAAGGDSRWISGDKSLKLAHRLRAEVDAVVIGMGTLRRDDPSLTVRNVTGNSPYRIVLSRSLDFPARCRLLDANRDCRTIIATTAVDHKRFARTARGQSTSLIFWHLHVGPDGRLDLRDLADKAHRFGFRSLLVEGGSQLATSFLQAGLVDKYIIITAPILLGEGINSIGRLGVRAVKDALAFKEYSFERSGSDMVFVGYLKRVD